MVSLTSKLFTDSWQAQTCR